MGMAQHIQESGGAIPSLIKETVARATKFIESPAFEELKSIANGIIEAEERAKVLSEMMRSDDEDLASLQRYLIEHPVTSLTLLALVSSEREQEAGELEKRFVDQAQQARSAKAKNAGMGRAKKLSELRLR